MAIMRDDKGAFSWMILFRLDLSQENAPYLSGSSSFWRMTALMFSSLDTTGLYYLLIIYVGKYWWRVSSQKRTFLSAGSIKSIPG